MAWNDICKLASMLALGGVCACSHGERSEHGTDPSGGGFGGGSDSTGDPTGDPGDGAGETDDDGFRYDVGQPDVPMGDEGCDNVDLLFVIDDSVSMADEQANLVASFPGFIAGIRERLTSAESYHVGVIATDAYDPNPPSCQALGALVTQTGGEASSNAACGPFAEGNFMTEADALAEGFECAARVGIDGAPDERPMEAIVRVMNGEVGACNEGFLRDDALLVVVIITDEEDDHELWEGEPWQGSEGDPADWRRAIVEAKAGIETNAVVLGIVGGVQGHQCVEFDGTDGAEDAVRIRQFTRMFTHGFLGDVCAPSYQPFFDEAIGVIDTACDDYIPPK